MSEITPSPTPVGRTRWRRFGLAAAGGFGLVALVGYLAATGAIALTIVFSGIPFTLTASSLTGNGFAQYAVPDQSTAASHSTGGVPDVTRAARSLSGNNTLNNVVTTATPSGGNAFISDTVTQFKTATIAGLNQVICAPTPLGNAIQVTLAGTGDTTATNLVIQSPALRANTATFNSIVIGESVKSSLARQQFAAGDDFQDPYDAQAGSTPSGAALGTSFGQNANTAELTGITQVGVGTEAGTFVVRGLNLYAEFVASCPLPTAP